MTGGQDHFRQQRFFYNHLIEKNDFLYRPFTNEPVYGDIYMYFLDNGRRTDTIFLGVITKKENKVIGQDIGRMEIKKMRVLISIQKNWPLD